MRIINYFKENKNDLLQVVLFLLLISIAIVIRIKNGTWDFDNMVSPTLDTTIGENEIMLISTNEIIIEELIPVPTELPDDFPPRLKLYREKTEPTPTIMAEEKYSEEDLRYMASIIQCEAGNQCLAGKQAVGIVVMNRVNHEIYFADTVKGVIYEAGQFTPAHNGNLDNALRKYDNGELSEECIEAAKYALVGNTNIIYNEVEYEFNYLYFNGRLSNAKVRIQDHDFA